LLEETVGILFCAFSFDSLPPPHRLVNYDDPKDALPGQPPQSAQEATYNGKEHAAWDQNSEMMFEQDLSWADAYWLKQLLPEGMPLIVKGIMTHEDATLALEAGVDAIMVSNHGGRQLDGCLAAIDALPEVVAAVNGRIPVLLDSGIRRGTDVVKALALGASAVAIGKPLFFALATGGEDGLVQMLKLLHKEIEAAMALCGCQAVDAIVRSHVGRKACTSSAL